MVQRFSRSLRVRRECVGQVRQAFVRSRFTRNQDLAEAAKLVLSTVQNFLSGKPLSRENFLAFVKDLSWM